MDALHKTLLVLTLVLVIAGSWLGYNYVQSRIELAKTQAQSDALKQANAAIDAATKARDAQVQALVDQIARTAAAAKTPQQIATYIPQQLPTPAPITINVPSATKENPTPDATAVIPQVDLPVIRDLIAGCKECNAKLAQSKADVIAAQTKEANAELDAAQWKTAAQGGSFWHKVKAASKYLGIGAGGAVVALCATGHCK